MMFFSFLKIKKLSFGGKDNQFFESYSFLQAEPKNKNAGCLSLTRLISVKLQLRLQRITKTHFSKMFFARFLQMRESFEVTGDFV